MCSRHILLVVGKATAVRMECREHITSRERGKLARLFHTPKLTAHSWLADVEIPDVKRPRKSFSNVRKIWYLHVFQLGSSCPSLLP